MILPKEKLHELHERNIFIFLITWAPAVKKLSRFWIFICLNSNLNSKKLL